MQKFSRVYPFWKPRVQTFLGVIDWRSGRKKGARKRWNKVIGMAERLDAPLELGIAHLEIARSLDSSNPQRALHLENAIRSFEKINAKGDLELANAVISS